MSAPTAQRPEPPQFEAPQSAIALHDGPRYDPPRRLSPAPAKDRRWRRLTTLLGGTLVLIAVLALTAGSVASWMSLREFDEVPATLGLGTPRSLSLDVAAGDVRVLPSDAVSEVTLSLVARGTSVPVGPDGRVRAELRRTGGPQHPVVGVDQPHDLSLLPGAGGDRDVLVLVPIGHVLDLELASGTGDLSVAGDFTALHASTEVGDVLLGPVTATEDLSVRTEVGSIDVELLSPGPAAIELSSQLGDIDLRMPVDATSRIGAVTDLGDVVVELPGTELWRVEARTELGEAQIDPGVEGAEGGSVGTLSLISSAGDITVTR